MEIDWHRIFFSDQPYIFFIEILIRTLITFLAVITVLRLVGKRGVKQLSIFEMVIIITLGSAAGDSMSVVDVGLVHTLFIFVVVLLAYRLLVLFVTKSEKAEKLLEGEPLYVVRNGKLCMEEVDGKMGLDEFFGGLREQNIEHLGQLRCVILEDTGELSVFYYPDEEVKPGLPILPDNLSNAIVQISSPGLYSCARCGNTTEHQPAEEITCEQCKYNKWVVSNG